MSSRNTYKYEITITTGIWVNAGTTAQVAMEIFGSEESTGILYLNTEEDLDDQLFSRGSTEVFLLTLAKPLGCVRGVRIGHDNSGKRPSWFLEDVAILDKQTLNSWVFSNNQWLALERGDGKIERFLETLRDESNFNKEVLNRWWKGLTENHIWVSVLAKPSSERFSRVQRASCCLSVLLSAMLANAMFYEIKGKSEQVIQVGLLKFSWRQVTAGILSALIFAPMNILIILLFKRGSSNRQTFSCTPCGWLVYFAWFLCFCMWTVSVTVTISYSLVWGKSISEQWLSSMFVSFIQDFTFTQPAKGFVTALLLAAIFRKRRNGDRLSTNEQNCQVLPKGRLWKMDLSEVERMRKRQTKKKNVSRFYVELLVYCMFVIIMMVVCYGNRNHDRYRMTTSIRNGLPKFNKVSSIAIILKQAGTVVVYTTNNTFLKYDKWQLLTARKRTLRLYQSKLKQKTESDWPSAATT